MRRSELIAFLQAELDAQRELHSEDGYNAVMGIIHKVSTETRFADTETTDCGADGVKVWCRSCGSVLRTVTHKSGRMESPKGDNMQNVPRPCCVVCAEPIKANETAAQYKGEYYCNKHLYTIAINGG